MSANNHRLKNINFPPTYKVWTSDAITQENLTSGQQINVNLSPNLPENVIPIGGLLLTSVETTSSSQNTTGLQASVGISGEETGYIMYSNLMQDSPGIISPTLPTDAPSLLGSINTDKSPLILQLTALGGGNEDVSDINQLNVSVIIYYIDISRQLP
jgi:hypothetical protein